MESAWDAWEQSGWGGLLGNTQNEKLLLSVDQTFIDPLWGMYFKGQSGKSLQNLEAWNKPLEYVMQLFCCINWKTKMSIWATRKAGWWFRGKWPLSTSRGRARVQLQSWAPWSCFWLELHEKTRRVFHLWGFPILGDRKENSGTRSDTNRNNVYLSRSCQ